MLLMLGLQSKLLSVRGAWAVTCVVLSSDLVDFVAVVLAAVSVGVVLVVSTMGGGGDSVSEFMSLICEMVEVMDDMEFVRFGAVTMIVEVPPLMFWLSFGGAVE